MLRFTTCSQFVIKLAFLLSNSVLARTSLVRPLNLRLFCRPLTLSKPTISWLLVLAHEAEWDLRFVIQGPTCRAAKAVKSHKHFCLKVPVSNIVHIVRPEFVHYGSYVSLCLSFTSFFAHRSPPSSANASHHALSTVKIVLAPPRNLPLSVCPESGSSDPHVKCTSSGSL